MRKTPILNAEAHDWQRVTGLLPERVGSSSKKSQEMIATKEPVDLADWWSTFSRHRSLAVYLILLVICIGSIVPIVVYLYPRVFPWWSDGGIWLKQLNALFGVEYPMWGETAFQLDQLYLLYLAALRLLLGNPLIALEASALLAYPARVATTFLLARKLFKSELAGLAAALVSGFDPLFYETLGWGGYPNLLGYALLPLAFYAMLTCIEKTSRKNLAFTALIVASVAFSHNLTSMVFLGVLGVWFILLAIKKATLRHMSVAKELQIVTISLAVVFVAYAVQILVTGWPAYNYFNEAAFYYLRIGEGDLVWAVKNQTIAFLLILAVVASFIMFRFLKRESARPYMFALASWILAPLLMSQIYLLGLAFDYRRAFLFSIQPILIMAMAPLTLLEGLVPNRNIALAFPQTIPIARLARKAVRVLPAAFIILLSLSVLFAQVEIGARWMNVVNNWYNQIDPYGDKEKMDALQWIMRSTPSNSVFVAEEPFGRWIEGLTSRRALLYVAPEYLFVKGESDRSSAARAVLECEVELRNDLIRVCDQYPYGNYTPTISFMKQGIYDDTFYINGAESKLYLSNGTTDWFERLGQNESLTGTHSLSVNSNSAIYETRQIYGDLTVARQVTVDAPQEQVSISYTAWTSSPNVRLLNLTIPLFSAEGVGFDEVKAESTNQIHVRALLPVGSISFHISLGGDIASAQLTYAPATDTILLNYGDKSKSTGTISATITISSDENAGGSESLMVFSLQDAVRQFNISYVVIPRVTAVSSSGMIPIKLLSLPLYDHLLEDPNLKVAYENPNVIILQVLCCQANG